MEPRQQRPTRRAIFVYDFRFYRRDSVVRMRHFPYSLWQERYLSVFPEIEVIGSDAHNPVEAESLPVSSGPGLKFTSVPSLSNLVNQITQRRHIHRLLQEKLPTADLTIIRLPSEIGYVASRVARNLNIPYVIEAVGCPFDALWNHGTIKGKLWAPIAKRNMQTALLDAPHAIYVTESFLQKRYPTRGKSIACSDVTIHSVAESPPPTIHLPLSDKPKILVGLIGYVGARYKGIDTAIRALARLRRPNVTLQVVGGGDPSPLKRLSRKLGIENQVEFLGSIPSQQVMTWLTTLDLYIQPSRQEGLPRSLLEAMSLGLPTIASTAGGIPELLPPEDLHEPSDHVQLSELLLRGLTDQHWREASSKRNLETAKRYQFSTLNARRHAFLHSAASNTNSVSPQFAQLAASS